MAGNKSVSVVGVNPPSDIVFGSIAEVRKKNMSCRCMTRISQQECRSIFVLYEGMKIAEEEKIKFVTSVKRDVHYRKMLLNIYKRGVRETEI